MKKTICIIAVAAISFGSINAYAVAPLQTQQQDTTKKKAMKKKMKNKKMMKDSSMKKDTAMKM
ncbi:hypothetical protein [Mucilaginibacter phyllosphaerae]|uniref:Pentapeptide MXKDX repeat protein n=1 Tax=Mucilaginibacter phyllosphaerae TaxID=1812349 RepID=A0A4Y8A608_9SPHI|nr:hypothetical protein [Mucilaginibacter phyllosphaerae]MBB3971084.1 hypothetical protein [Mucilaginibacter phyllosphaerae]TEW63822.1 hypothetical protein E2R65_18830 [Mucilaginibacter phyllosphaerae]GGH22373.1 hypothetical protein GCM10007352_35660 [Mucilaginibacter phyllosphaerae]